MSKQNTEDDLPQADDDLPQAGMSRREMLKRVTLGITGAAVVGTGAYALLGSSDDLPHAPITQDRVNDEYTRLYDYLAEQKQIAEKSGKKLAVVIAAAADHDRNSLLQQFMLLDIANRLGIKDMALDMDKDQLSFDSREVGRFIKSRNDAVKKRLLELGVPPEELNSKVNHEKLLLSLIPELSGDLYNKSSNVAHSYATHNSFLAMMRAKDLEMRSFSREEADKVLGKRHGIAIYDAAHMPSMLSKLKNDPKIHVLGINMTAGRAGKKASTEQESPQTLYTPNLSSKIQLISMNALAMTFVASTKHQLEKGEITPDEATRTNATIKRLRTPTEEELRGR